MQAPDDEEEPHSEGGVQPPTENPGSDDDDAQIEYPIRASGEAGLFRFDPDEGELLEIGDLYGCPALGELAASRLDVVHAAGAGAWVTFGDAPRSPAARRPGGPL